MIRGNEHMEYFIVHFMHYGKNLEHLIIILT